MKKYILSTFVLTIGLSLGAMAQQATVPAIAGVPEAARTAAASIDAEKIRAHVKFLASDLLEGRGPGTRGGDLATEYIATQFALAGLKPAGDHGTYFQQVPLIGIATEPSATLSAQKGGQALDLRWESEFVGVNERLTAED